LTADLPATNKLVPLVRMLDRPVPIMLAESGWLGQQLPQVDKDFLAQRAHPICWCRWRWPKAAQKH